MEVERSDLLTVGVAVGRSAEIKTREHQGLRTSILHFHLAKIDPATAQVKQELLRSIGILKWDTDQFPTHGEIPFLPPRSMFFQTYQGVGLRLGQADFGHKTALQLRLVPGTA